MCKSSLFKFSIFCVAFIFSAKSYAMFQVSFVLSDNTSAYYSGGRTQGPCNGIAFECIENVSTGGNTGPIYFYSPDGKKRFKFYLVDTENWALHAYYGDPIADKNSFIRLDRESQIQLHWSDTVVYAYANAAGVSLSDADGKIFEFVKW